MGAVRRRVSTDFTLLKTIVFIAAVCLWIYNVSFSPENGVGLIGAMCIFSQNFSKQLDLSQNVQNLFFLLMGRLIGAHKVQTTFCIHSWFLFSANLHHTSVPTIFFSFQWKVEELTFYARILFSLKLKFWNLPNFRSVRQTFVFLVAVHSNS